MRLLIVGDLEGQLGTASKIAKDNGAKVSHVMDIDAAMNALRIGQGADLLMVDVAQNIHLLTGMLSQERIIVPIVACGIESDKDAAVAAIRAGAKEYIPLPPDAELIAAVLHAISEESNSVIYQSEIMAKVIAVCDQIAPSDANVLITGESGTGKEVIARYVHHKSNRANQAFISVNCAAIPENLLESELFGHEKGSFTGATARRIGKFEEANNGTLLLDEISEMDVRLQAKLLRAIQEGEIDRVGGTKPVKVNLRILTTSNRNLQEEVKKSTFREDLFFRLNVIQVQLPALRERKEDIPLLANHFAAKYCKANGFTTKQLSEEATFSLQSYHWPGNVRELENTMHRAVLVSPIDSIEAEAIIIQNQMGNVGLATNSNFFLPASDEETPATKEANELVGRTVESVEKELILDTLDYCLGNRTHAANILGISIRTLRNKLKLYAESDTGNDQPRASSG